MDEAGPPRSDVYIPLHQLAPGNNPGDILVFDGLLWTVVAGLSIHPDPHRLSSGSAGAPTYSFNLATNTGIYLNGTSLGTSVGGTLVQSASSTLNSFYKPIAINDTPPSNSPNITVGHLYKKVGSPDLWWNVNGVETSLVGSGGVSDPLLLSDGTASDPTYSFGADAYTGMYSPGVGSVGLTAGGVLGIEVTSTTVNILHPLHLNDQAAPVPIVATEGYIYKLAADSRLWWKTTSGAVELTTPIPMIEPIGSAGAPAYTFTGDNTTGVYSPTTGQVGITNTGTLSLLITTSQVKSNRVLNMPSGSFSLPSIVFNNVFDTGIYSSAGTVSITISGTDNLVVGNDAVTVATDQLLVPSGSVSIPSISFTADTNTGIYQAAADSIGVTINGVSRIQVDATLIKLQTTIVLSESSISAAAAGEGRLYKLVGDGGLYWNSPEYGQLDLTRVNSVAFPLLGPAGTAGAPIYSFASDTNTGIYNSSSDTLAVTAGGTKVFHVSTSEVRTVLPFAMSDASVAPPVTPTITEGYLYKKVGQSGLWWKTNGGDIDVTNIIRDPSLLSDGTAVAPTYSFTSDTDTGMFLDSVGQLGFTVGGTLVWTMTSTTNVAAHPIREIDGSSVAPSYTFAGDSSTGLYKSGVSAISLATAGTQRLEINTVSVISTLPIIVPIGAEALPSITFSGDTSTGLYSTTNAVKVSVGGVLKATIDATNVTASVTYKGPVGSVGSPTYSFTGTSTGIFQPSGSNIGFSINGVQSYTMNNVGFTSTLPIYLPLGSVGAPSISFTGDTNTGIYSTGADAVAVCTNGIKRLEVDTATLTSTLSVIIPVGSVGAPSISFSGDNDTGLYHSAADTIGLVTGGASRLTINAVNVTSTLPYYVPDGSDIAPSYTFTSSTQSGLFWDGSLGVAFGGVKVGYIDAATLSINLALRLNDVASPVPALVTEGYLYKKAASSGLWWKTTGGETDITSNVIVAPILIDNGSASIPSYSFTADPDTGIYRISENILGFTAGSTLRMSMSDTNLTTVVPIYNIAGAVGTPSYTTTTDTDTGIYFPTANQLAIAAGGVKVLSITQSVMDITSSSVTHINGSATVPPITFTNDTSTGMYLISAGTLGITTTGTLRITVNSAGITTALPYLSGAGSASNPTYSFSADTDTGLYRIAADQLGLSTGGAVRVAITSTDTTFSGDIIASDTIIIHNSSVSAPGVAAEGHLYKKLGDDGLFWNTLGSGEVDLAHPTVANIVGVLPVAKGGTNSNVALNNNRIMVSSGGSIVEAAALTDGQLLIGSTGVAPVAASLVAGAGIIITPGAGSISIATTVSAERISLSTILMAFLDASLVTVAFYGWIHADLGTYTTRTIKLWADPDTTRDLVITVYSNNRLTTHGTRTISPGVMGSYSFTITNPGADTLLEVTAQLSGAPGTSAKIYNMELLLS